MTVKRLAIFLWLACVLPSAAFAQLTASVPPNLAVSYATQGSVYNSNIGGGGVNGGAILSFTGGTGPYSCSVTSGSIPPGMSIAEVTPIYPAGLCVISGTPTVAGHYTWTEQVTDNLSATSSASVDFVVKSSSLPSFSALSAASASPTSETITWTTNVAASSRVCYEQTYAVTQCSPETDTAGVTAHSVTLTGLWPAWSYQYFVISRGISGGVAVDWLANSDSNAGCCNDVFAAAAAPATGTWDFYFVGQGPHNVIQGFPLYAGIYAGDLAGTNFKNLLKIQVTGIPANTKVHWPDQQDNGLGQGAVSTTTTTDDTLTLGSANFTQFEILSNVGGTTPVGNYTLTVTATTTPTSGGISTHNFTYAYNVAAPSFPSGTPGSYPAIPQKALWETNMTTYGATWASQVCGFVLDQQCIWYYDGDNAYRRVAIYTGNSATWTPASANARTRYNAVVNAQSPAGTGLLPISVFPHGLYNDCINLSSGTHAQSCTNLNGIANRAQAANMWANGLTYADAVNVREGCYMLGAKRLNFDAGGSSTLAQVLQMAAYCLGDVDQIVNGYSTFEESVFDGIVAESLIDYYNDPNTGNSDPRVPPAIKALADHVWSNNWIPWSGTNGYCVYNLFEAPYLPNQGLGTNTDPQALNNLIAPMFAWLYMKTGQQIYLLEGDAIFASGALDPPSQGIGFSGKNYSQQYRWSFDYITWRSVPVAPAPAVGIFASNTNTRRNDEAK